MRSFVGGVLWTLLCLSASAQVGDLAVLAVVDPGPNFTPETQEAADYIVPAISADGRFVFFGSASAGLASPSVGQTIQSARITPSGAEVVSTMGISPHDGKSVSVSPNGAVLAAHLVGSNVLNDAMAFFDIDATTGALTPRGTPTDLGGDGRGRAPLFHPTGDYVYTSIFGAICVVSTSGFASVPDQTIPLGSARTVTLVMSADGTTLAAIARDETATINDEFIVYDVDPMFGTLAERGRFAPGRDLDWQPATEAVVNRDGTRAIILDRGVPTQLVTLDITQAGSFTGVLSGVDTFAANRIALSASEGVLAAVQGGNVACYDVDENLIPTPRSVFNPPTGTFSTDNSLLLSPDGRFGLIANELSNTIFSFATSGNPGGAPLPPLDQLDLSVRPTWLVGTPDRSRIFVMHAEEADPGRSLEVIDVFAIRPSLNATAVYDVSGLTSFLESSPIAVDTLGRSADAGSTSNTQLFDAQARGTFNFATSIHAPSSAVDTATSPGAPQLHVSIDAETAHVWELTSADGSLGVINPRSSAPDLNHDFTMARIALSPDGTRIFVPDVGLNQIHVFDTATSPTLMEFNPYATPNLSSPRAVTMSPGGSTLAVIYGLDFDVDGPTVKFLDVGPGGELSNPRGDPLPFVAVNSRVQFLSETRAVVGAGAAGVVLMDAATGATLDTMLPGDCQLIAQVATAPGHPRFLATDPSLGQTVLMEVDATGNTLRFIGGSSAGDVTPSSEPLMTPDGRFGLIPDARLSPNGGLALLDLTTDASLIPLLGRSGDGSTARLTMDGIGNRVASIDFEKNRVLIHSLSRLGRPRLTRCVILEDSAPGDRFVGPGESLLLSFDRPIQTSDPLMSNSDLFFSQGAFLGSDSTVAVNPFAPNQAVVTIGPMATGVNADLPGASVDISASRSEDRFHSLFETAPAIDLGVADLNDAGVSLESLFAPVTVTIDPVLGGVVSVEDGAAFDGHSLAIPPGSLSQSADFILRPADLEVARAGFPNAISIETDLPPNGPIFQPPATLTLEFDPAVIDLELGQSEDLIRIGQIQRTGEIVTATPITTTHTIDTQANTVSIQINDLNPAGFTLPTLAGIGGGQAGTFVTLPVNPVEERSIFIAPSAGGASLTGVVAPSLSAGPAGAYTDHSITFPGHVQTTSDDPNRIEVRMRTSTIFERVSLADGQSFPAQSAALFTVETRGADGNPMAFTDPVDVRVQFIERADPNATDVVTLAGAAGEPFMMRTVRDTVDGMGVSFALEGGDRSGSTALLSGFTPLTGPSGLATFGAAVDPDAMAPVPTPQGIVDHILGRTPLEDDEFTAADLAEPLGVIDVADLVTLVNAGG